MIQATIWSGRQHCEAAVVDGLRAQGEMDFRWFVHDTAQAARLMDLSEGMAVKWTRLDAATFPQLVSTDPHAREAKIRACANAFNTVIASMAGYYDDLLLVDDDIVLPTAALTQLQATAAELHADAVSGLTRCGNGALPVFRFSDQHRMTDAEIPAKPMLIDAVGTFCMYLTAPVVSVLHNYWPAVSTKTGAAVLHGHDLNFCRWLRTQGFRLALDPAVRCQHHVLVEPGRVDILRT